jgi:hypothetical protein
MFLENDRVPDVRDGCPKKPERVCNTNQTEKHLTPDDYVSISVGRPRFIHPNHLRAVFFIQRIQKMERAIHTALTFSRIESVETNTEARVRDTSGTRHRGLKDWLMLDLIERTIALRTQRLYEEREHAEGRKLEDWLKAASEVLLTLNIATRRGRRGRHVLDDWLQAEVEILGIQRKAPAA